MEEIAARADEWSRLSQHPIVVVTAVSQRRRAGCLVGYHTRVAAAPPRYMVALSTANHTYRVAVNSAWLTVHLLEERHRHLAELFGGASGDDRDKFQECQWSPGPDGIPLLDDVPGRLVGRTLRRIPFGDHVGFEIGLTEVSLPAGKPMLASSVSDISAGHELPITTTEG